MKMGQRWQGCSTSQGHPGPPEAGEAEENLPYSLGRGMALLTPMDFGLTVPRTVRE